ncbi:MAG: stage V sporulation protein AD [Ruminococcaceae bacterium]|nr:stage V sporulation protein AD [Oscillospiraceae bacterium]
MNKRIGKQTVKLTQPISIISSANIVGKKEGEGPLSQYFDTIMSDATWGESSWEKAESKMQNEALSHAIQKASLTPDDIDYVLAGDLLNQCISSSFALRDLSIPFFGIYGACSTMAETISLGSMLLDGDFAKNICAVTSSHFCTAERQYRQPLEYGGQRTPTAQWTVTGSGSVVLSKNGNGPYVTHITTGKIIDMGIKDANNMGAAMAPAAADTLKAHFSDTGFEPNDYDLILTGDLGTLGKEILIDLMMHEKIDLRDNYDDCGCLIFDADTQDTHAGGSGCGCGAVTLTGYVLSLMKEQKLNNVLFMATGALLSPTSTMQGESIPSVAHAISISNNLHFGG